MNRTIIPVRSMVEYVEAAIEKAEAVIESGDAQRDILRAVGSLALASAFLTKLRELDQDENLCESSFKSYVQNLFGRDQIVSLQGRILRFAESKIHEVDLWKTQGELQFTVAVARFVKKFGRDRKVDPESMY